MRIKFNMVTKIWVLILWAQTLTFVKCQEVKCDVPVIDHGSVSGGRQQYNENEVLNFNCDPSFKRTDDRQSRCMKVGTGAEWIPTPGCKLIQCELTPLPGTTYRPPNQNLFLPREKLQVTCGERDYILDPKKNTADVTCKADGEWNISPVCLEVRCPNNLPNENLYRYVHAWGNKLGNTVGYDCKRNYRKPHGVTHATCTRDGWTPKPLCQSSFCERPDIENAEMIGRPRRSYRHGDEVTYRCLEGVRDSFTATCERGTWTGNSGCSVSAYCEKLQDVKLTVKSTMVKERYSDGEVIEYVCNTPGIHGGNATCVNRKWNKTVECPAIPCEIDTLTTGLRINGFPPKDNRAKAGQKLTFFCLDNYVIEGSEETECLATGQWKDPFPTCYGSVCRNPPLLEDGDTVELIKAEYQLNERVQYMCQNRYIMQGGPYKTCTRGVWTGEIRCLKPCTVDTEEMSKRNIQLAYGYINKIYVPHNDHITFACKGRTTQVGSESMRKVCIDGELDLPTCQ